MKLALVSLFATASAFAPQQNARLTTSLAAEGRRDVINKMAGAAAAFIPVAAANAAAGESPRFSVFGLIGDGSSYSEGAAYGSDYSSPTYSPYSVYGDVGEKSVYKSDTASYTDRKKAVLAETKTRLSKLSAYIEKKKWFEVKNELTRYMYETRGAVRGLAQTPEQKKKADAFFKSIEATYTSASLKKQDACAKAAADSIAAFDAFTASI